jgi:thioredoxin 1
MAGKNIVEVTDQTFEATVLKSDKPAMVDFWATWCGPCLALGPTLEALADEYAGRAVVAKLNVDDSRLTAAKYRITSIPTILFFKGGKLVESLVGARPKAALKDVLDKHLYTESR